MVIPKGGKGVADGRPATGGDAQGAVEKDSANVGVLAQRSDRPARHPRTDRVDDAQLVYDRTANTAHQQGGRGRSVRLHDDAHQLGRGRGSRARCDQQRLDE